MRLTRRSFLEATAAGVGAFGLPGCATGQSHREMLSRIIDCHTHFYDPTRPQGVPWPPP